MLKIIKRLLLCTFFFVLLIQNIYADSAVYTNPETGYEVYINDEADLLTDTEEQQLLEKMKPITEYGGVAFVSNDEYTSSSSDLAESMFRQYFGRHSGSVFLIDMYKRNLYIFSDGEIYRTITKSYANTITDNVYTHASYKDYYTCAAKAFEQMNVLLEGGKIARPMKVITNILLAIIISILLNYALVIFTRRRRVDASDVAVAAITTFAAASVGDAVFKSQERKRIESSSGGGGGGFGGGGGGSSGGGGGHSF